MNEIERVKYKRRVRHRIAMARIREKGELQRMKDEERAEREKYWPRKKINTSKLGLWYMVIMATIIQIFSMVAMWHFQDLSPLMGLIAATVGEVFTYWSYANKAAKENCEGGITYEMALRNEEQNPMG